MKLYDDNNTNSVVKNRILFYLLTLLFVGCSFLTFYNLIEQLNALDKTIVCLEKKIAFLENSFSEINNSKNIPTEISQPYINEKFKPLVIKFLLAAAAIGVTTSASLFALSYLKAGFFSSFVGKGLLGVGALNYLVPKETIQSFRWTDHLSNNFLINLSDDNSACEILIQVLGEGSFRSLEMFFSEHADWFYLAKNAAIVSSMSASAFCGDSSTLIDGINHLPLDGGTMPFIDQNVTVDQPSPTEVVSVEILNNVPPQTEATPSSPSRGDVALGYLRKAMLNP